MENVDVIYGKNSVLEALNVGNREINKILISKNIHSDIKINKIKELAANRGIVFQFVGREKFQPYEEFNHQGIIAMVAPIKYMELEDFIQQCKLKSGYCSVVLLDGVEDAHNLGAIIRTCVCAGVDGIIIPSRRNVQVNSVVEKISAGAVNHIPIIKVNSPVNAIQRLKENDWWVIATDASASDNYYDVKIRETISPYNPSASEKISISIIPTKILSSCPIALTPASPAIPMLIPAPKQLRPHTKPDAKCLYPSFKL